MTEGVAQGSLCDITRVSKISVYLRLRAITDFDYGFYVWGWLLERCRAETEPLGQSTFEINQEQKAWSAARMRKVSKQINDLHEGRYWILETSI